MEKIAKATIENAALMQGVMHRHMRAYVSAEVEGAIYQDERLKFQVDIRLTNSGFTPARNVSYAIAADVLGDTLPADFSFPNSGAINTNDATLSPRGTFIIHGFLKNRLSDADAEAVMTNEGKRLHCWGTIYYEDIFGDKWETNFCVSINFNRYTDAEGKFRVRQTHSYHPKHNNAT